MDRKIALALITPLIVAGCASAPPSNTTAASGSPSPSATPGDAKALKIAVIPKGATADYWLSVKSGAQKAADELKVQMVWQSPLKEDDRDGQIKVVENFVQTKVDGIVLAPCDERALAPSVQEALDAKIPVIIIDSKLNGPKVTSFIATDNYAAGKMDGVELAKILHGMGKVIVLKYAEGQASTEAREKGFEDAAKAGGLTIVSDDQHAGVTRESAQSASENLLQRFKQGDALSADAIFTPNESSTFGMLRALQNAKLTGKVHFVGFDSSTELIKGLQAGEIDGLVLQNPIKMGYEGVSKMVASLKGQKIPEIVDTGATFVTKANMETPEVKALLPK